MNVVSVVGSVNTKARSSACRTSFPGLIGVDSIAVHGVKIEWRYDPVSVKAVKPSNSPQKIEAVADPGLGRVSQGRAAKSNHNGV